MKRLAVFAACYLAGAGFFASPSMAQSVGRDAYESFIERRQLNNHKRHDILADRGLLPLYGRLLEALPDAEIVFPTGGSDSPPDQVHRLVNTFANDLALYASSLGVADQGKQHDEAILEAASRAMRGVGTADDYVALSDLIVIARAAGKDARGPSDGYLSGERFVVSEVLKGDARRGQKVVVRQTSGKLPDGTVLEVSSDLSPTNGRTYLLFLSSSYYRQLVLESGKVPHADRSDTLNTILLAGAYEVSGSKLNSVTPFAPILERLSEVSSLLSSQ